MVGYEVVQVGWVNNGAPEVDVSSVVVSKNGRTKKREKRTLTLEAAISATAGVDWPGSGS